MGRGAKTFLKQTIDLEIQPPHQPRKETDSMPSPFGEGQTDMPINRPNQGEVADQTPLPSPPRGRSYVLLKLNIDLETRRPISEEKKPTPCPLHLERGKRTCRSFVPIRVRSQPPGLGDLIYSLRLRIADRFYIRSLYFPNPEGNLLEFVCYDASVG